MARPSHHTKNSMVYAMIARPRRSPPGAPSASPDQIDQPRQAHFPWMLPLAEYYDGGAMTTPPTPGRRAGHHAKPAAPAHARVESIPAPDDQPTPAGVSLWDAAPPGEPALPDTAPASAIRDSLYDFIPLGALELDLIGTPEFVRLQGVKQLGFCYRVWPEIGRASCRERV